MAATNTERKKYGMIGSLIGERTRPDSDSSSASIGSGGAGTLESMAETVTIKSMAETITKNNTTVDNNSEENETTAATSTYVSSSYSLEGCMSISAVSDSYAVQLKTESTDSTRENADAPEGGSVVSGKPLFENKRHESAIKKMNDAASEDAISISNMDLSKDCGGDDEIGAETKIKTGTFGGQQEEKSHNFDRVKEDFDPDEDKQRDKSIPKSIVSMNSYNGMVYSELSLSGSDAALMSEDVSVALKDELYKYMREEPGMFDWIQDALGDGVWYSSVEPYHIWYSPAFKESFGYDGDDDFPQNWWMENIFPDDLVKAIAAYNVHLETGSPYDIIVRYRHRDGSTVWIRCHGKAVFDKDGKPIRVLGAHNDLSALMNVQEDLKKKEAVLDLLTSTSLDGYWDWDLLTGDLHMSSRFKSLLGYTDAELANRIETWWSLLLPEDVPKVLDAIEKCKSEGKGEEYDQPPLLNIVLRYQRKNGTIASMLAQGVAQSIPISSSTSIGEEKKKWVRMFGTHTDVSYLEEARAARDASAAKTVFLATMSHEIRTPLNAVLGMAEVLMTTELTEEQKDCVTTLHNSGIHLLSLISDILDFSQIESGIVNLSCEDVDIQHTVRSVMDVLQHSADQKNLLLTFHTLIPARKIFKGDSERIRQLTFNLLGNAVKFTTVGSVNVSVYPTSAMRNESAGQLTSSVSSHATCQDGIQIVIQDTGCGILLSQHNKIFDDFHQAGHEIRSKFGGSGLGLSICKRLIRAMGGSIDVQSDYGKGSTFTVWLPGRLIDKAQSLSQPEKRAQILNECSMDFQLDQPLHQNQDALQSCALKITSEDANDEESDRIAVESRSDKTQNTVPRHKNLSNTSLPTVSLFNDSKNTGSVDNFVFLYEELEYKDSRGSVEGALLGAGRTVHRVTDVNDVIDKISVRIKTFASSIPPFFPVVVHRQSRQNGSSLQGFVTDLLNRYQPQVGHSTNSSTITISLFDVGHQARSYISDQYKTNYNILPAFPTSDEIFDIFVSKFQSKIRNFPANTSIKHPEANEELERNGTKKVTRQLPSNSNPILKILLAEDNLINQKVMRKLLSRFPCQIEVANDGKEAVEFFGKNHYDLM
jgi:PAS domain S-box-containing protein